MIFINKVTANSSFPGRSSCALQSNAEFAVHLKKNGVSYATEHSMVNYKSFGYVDSSFSAMKNTIDNIPGLAQNEGITHPNPPPGKSRLLRPEQKSVLLMKELVSRFSQPGDVVVDFFAGTFSTAVACFSLPQHRFFAGVEKDADCFQVARNHAEDRFAQNMCNPNFNTDISLPDDILEIACRLAASSTYEEVSDKNWKAPPGLPQYQIFPPHIFSYFTSVLRSNDFFRQYTGSDLSSWPLEIQQRFNALTQKELLNSEISHYCCFVKESLIKHPNAGLGMFAGKSFNPGDVICFYFGTLVYDDLQPRKSKTKMYGGSSVMQASVQRFNHFAIQLTTSGSAFNEVKASAQGKRAVYIVPPPWCIGSYINDFKYDEGDSDYERYMDPKIVLSNERRANVMFAQTPNPVNNVSSLHSYNCVAVKAITQINMGEELYADYSRSNFGLS